ncbi:MAG: CHY zinc finger protein [Halanaeroarchaeum sp.]
MRRIGAVEVRGVELDGETRCAHYDTERDVVAIRFRCCTEFYACIQCHEALADHDPTVWPREAFEEDAVLCGACGTTLSIEAYLAADDACPNCGAAFNPGCAAHHHHYFDVDPDDAGS